jgi:branched-chain amino acid transport system substrate-binding protein
MTPAFTSRLGAIARALALAAPILVFPISSAYADIVIGVTLCATGPAASLGVPEKNTTMLFADSIGGEKINVIVLDDGTDPAQAVRNVRKLISEDHADVIIGSSSVPTSIAVSEVATETMTPQIALAPFDLPPEKNKWIFRTPQHNALMAQALAAHMKAHGVKTLGFIGFADGFGEGWLREMTKAADANGIKLVDVERYNRTDTSVTGQAIKLVAANPDAILIVGSGTPAALPEVALADRGYHGKFYQSHGAANREFLKIGGKALDGTVLPVGPIVVADQLPDSFPSKRVALDYTKAYEDRFGEGSVSSFGGHMYDAYRLLQAAIPVALKKAKPGTPEFRAALRDALETQREVVGVHGVFNMSPTDHFGHDERARVVIRIENGNWKLEND